MVFTKRLSRDIMDGRGRTGIVIEWIAVVYSHTKTPFGVSFASSSSLQQNNMKRK